MSNLLGKSHTFDDGSKIEIIQVKQREDDNDGNIEVITYLVTQGEHSLPRKLLMPLKQFISTYGHLFED